MKPEVLKAVTKKFPIFCDVTSCCLAEIYKILEGPGAFNFGMNE